MMSFNCEGRYLQVPSHDRHTRRCTCGRPNSALRPPPLPRNRPVATLPKTRRILQALEHCRRGNDAQADAILEHLGCAFRLAPGAFQDLALSTCTLEGASVLVLDDIVSGAHGGCVACCQYVLSNFACLVRAYGRNYSCPQLSANCSCVFRSFAERLTGSLLAVSGVLGGSRLSRA